METLYAYAYLWVFGLSTKEAYNKRLDNLFLADSNDEMLLELEGCSDDRQNTLACLHRHFTYEAKEFDAVLFGKTLFSGLEIAYQSDQMQLSEFGRKCYQMWNELPYDICMEEPVYRLSYADDCLSYGDERQARELYESVFAFFK